MSKKPTRKQIWRDILRLLQNNGHKSYRPKEIAKKLGYKDNRIYRVFRDVLTDMEAAGTVAHVKGGRYTHQSRRSPMQAEGTLHVTSQGYGFVSVDGRKEDLYVRRSKLNNAFDGDRVRVSMLARARRDRRKEAEVIEILERRRTQTVGTFVKTGHFAFVRSDDLSLPDRIYIAQEEYNGAKHDDKVVVALDYFDDLTAAPEGRVLRVLDPSKEKDVAVLALAMSKDVRAYFPETVRKETDTITPEIPPEEYQHRLDLRDKRIFTIDPDDARDFDDAIHIERLPDGNFEVGVHIADVSHYVRPGTAVDGEAYLRATSVYLVDRVIPMLPEELSNAACSLRPDEDKLTYSCIMTVSPRGAVKSHSIKETIIHSMQRFTYEQAQDVLDDEQSDHPLADDLRMAAKLARTLTKKRFREGSVRFDTPEVKIELDETGHPIRIARKERKQTHRLIEEFMLLANRAVAEHIGRRRKADFPFVYRIHDRPDSEKIKTLADYVKVFGYHLPLHGGNVTPGDLNNLLEHVRGTHEEPVIQEAALRAMAKAAYAPENIGHYGLGFKHYTHFTSPIRRYPDLMVHRLLKAYSKPSPPSNVIPELAQRCEHCSARERAAEEAERASVKLKQVEYIEDHIGDQFTGVVSGVTRFGVFVELDELLVEGLVHVRTMNDYFEYDESAYALIGTHTGRIIRLGDSVSVIVVDADRHTRQIDFRFI